MQQPGVHWEPNSRCWGVWLCFNTARSHCVYILAVFSTLPTALIYSVSCHTSIFPRQSPQYSPGLTKRERERQTGISSTFANTACQSSSQTTQREPQCFRSQRSPHSTLLMWLITKLSLLSLVCLCVVTFLKFRQMFTLTAFLTPTGSVWRLATLPSGVTSFLNIFSSTGENHWSTAQT